MGKFLKFKQFWCGHRGSVDGFELNVTLLSHNKKVEVEITNKCVKCGAETSVYLGFLTPSEYVRFNSKHLFDKFVQTYADERVYDYMVISEGIKKDKRVRKI